MSRASKTGLTIIEVLITSALLSVFMITVGNAVVLAYNNQVVMSHKYAAVRQSHVALDLLARELRMSTYVLRPQLGIMAVGSVLRPEYDTPLIFVRNSALGQVAVVWWLDKLPSEETGTLRRTIVHCPDVNLFNPEDPSSWSPVPGETLTGRRLGYDVQDFTIARLDQPTPRTMETTVSVLKVQQPIVMQTQVLTLNNMI